MNPGTRILVADDDPDLCQSVAAALRHAGLTQGAASALVERAVSQSLQAYLKGGRRAAACVGTTITLAISDVVGDDLHAIGSGPGVPDSTTCTPTMARMSVVLPPPLGPSSPTT